MCARKEFDCSKYVDVASDLIVDDEWQGLT